MNIDINMVVACIFMVVAFYLGSKTKSNEPKKTIIQKIEEHKEKKHRQSLVRDTEKNLQEQIRKIDEYNGN